jgi:geranylgeranyl reductase family protein
MTKYDAIVAGAGPAGSMAARKLAEAGARVLLLDKARFPRDKPCGGGVTLRAASVQSASGGDLSPVIERTIYGARFSLNLGGSFDRRYSRPLTYMTQRCRLDEHLVAQAAEAGADLHDGEAVQAVDAALRSVNVRTGSGAYEARVLIAADGANGTAARRAGIAVRREEAVALEGNVRGVPVEWEDAVGLDIGGLAGGYGWVFPKGDHMNVGVGAWKYAGFTLRSKLDALSRRYGVRHDEIENLRGHHLPVRLPGSPVARGPVALAGDAAGLVDPLSGEGIHMAFASGRLAAEHGLGVLSGEAADMSGYGRAVDRELQPELTVSRRLQELLHFAPPPYLALMRRSQKFWHFFCLLIRGELTYLDFYRIIGPLSAVVNVTADIAERRRRGRVASGERLLAAAGR